MNKIAGGPGSGSSENNTKEIKNMPKSKHVSVGTRKSLLNNMPFTEEVIYISKITHVSQSKFTPNKLKKMIKNWKFIKDKPIEVLKVGHEYHVIDGHHRYLAAKELGEKTIKANVYVKREEKTAGSNELGDAIKDHFKPITDKWDKRFKGMEERKGKGWDENKVKSSDFDTLLHNFKNNILVDLDNVIHDMDKYDDNKIDGKPVEGAKEWIDKLKGAGKHIYILSARSCRNFDSKKELIEKWLDKYGIYYDEVVDKKVPASVFIDDRAIAFHGDWEDAYNEAVNFKPVQDQKGDYKLLKHTKWLELRDKGGIIYSHEVSCGGQKVAVLPYRRVGIDGYEVLLREELNPAWSKEPVLSSITGGVELGEDKRSAARRELLEETGFGVKSADLKYVGYCYGSKMSDSIYHLFCVDVTGLKSTLPKGDGSKLEDKAKNKFWKWDTEAKRECKDPLVAMLISRMSNGDVDLEDKFSPICYQLGLDKIPEHKIPLVEELSEIVHNQWMDLARGVLATEKISDKRRKRWESYMVPYDKLNESNKEKDRVWARKYLLAAKNVSDEKKASWRDSYSEEELNAIKEAGILQGALNLASKLPNQLSKLPNQISKLPNQISKIPSKINNLPDQFKADVIKMALPDPMGQALGNMGFNDMKMMAGRVKMDAGIIAQKAKNALGNKLNGGINVPGLSGN